MLYTDVPMAENLQQLLEQKDRDLELAAQYGTALLEENKQLKQKMKELKERVAGMEMEGSYEMKEQIQLLEESNKILNSKITILESKNGDLEAKIILKNAQKEDLAQTIDELMRKHKNAEERIAMLQKELENNSTAGTIYDLNEQLEMQKEVIQDLRAKNADLQRANTDLTKKLEDATKKVDQLNSTQVSNEIDPAIIEELKELRQSNAQFKREMKEKDEIIKELQTRPSEARPTIYQRTIVEVPVYDPVPGNSDTASENTPNGYEHDINTDSDITVQRKIDSATDTQTSTDALTPVTHTSHFAPLTTHATPSATSSDTNATSTPVHHTSQFTPLTTDATPSVTSTTSTPVPHTSHLAPLATHATPNDTLSDTNTTLTPVHHTSQFTPLTADATTPSVTNTTLTPITPMTPTTATAHRDDPESSSTDSNSSVDLFNTTYGAKRDEEHGTEVTTTNGYAKTEPMSIQNTTEGGQTATKATEKTPPSSPKALYRDPRVQELATKLAEAERLLSIRSDEVQRLSLKLADLAEQRVSFVPQTTIINQVVQPKKEGFLVKQGARVKNWKRRFFFIESDFLYYSESPKSRYVTLGMIKLDRSEVDQAIVPNRAHVIAVKTSDRTYYLCADSEEDMHEWLNVLKEKVEEIAEKKRNEK